MHFDNQQSWRRAKIRVVTLTAIRLFAPGMSLLRTARPWFGGEQRIAQELFQRPTMLAETGHHRRCPVVIPRWFLLDFLTQGARQPAKVVVHDAQPSHCHMKHQLLGEGVYLAS